jgi:uncharacterized protein (TIGR03435 family)
LILAASAWLILRVFRVRHPASRHAVWTAVLIGMMVLPLVSVFAPQWKLPLLPKRSEIVAQTPVQQSENFTNEESSDARLNTVVPAQQRIAKFAWPSPQKLIVGCYFAGLLAMALFRLMGWVLLGRVMSKSCVLRARLRESREVITPVTVGVLRPSVILPIGWRKWNANTKRAVLAHEFAHIRRRDTLTSSLTRFANCIYWFHPLAWWISRQVSDLAELSCDVAVLEKNGDPGDYSRILLGFAETVNTAGYRATLPGLAMASRSGMGRRIEQVFELAGGNLRRLSRPGTVLVLLGLPVMCIAAVVGLTAPASRVLHHATAAIIPSPPVLVAQAQQPAAAPAQPAREPLPDPAPKSKFDVISIKPCTPGMAAMGRGGPTTAPRPGGGPAPGLGGYFAPSSGRLSISCGSVMTMVNIAFVDGGNPLTNSSGSPLGTAQNIKGVPDWAMSARYTIEAETEDPVANGPTDGMNSPAWKLMMGPMLQSLLEDRFRLKFHRDAEDLPMYNLVVAKGGLKLKPMEAGDCQQPEPGPSGRGMIIRPLGPNDKPYCGWMGGNPHGPNRTVLGGGVPVRRLADFLSTFVMDRHVIDKTGLTTVVNIHLEFAPDDNTPCEGPALNRCQVDPNSDIPAGPTIFTALEQQLGLKLEPTKAPHGYIAIDHVEPPSEN